MSHSNVTNPYAGRSSTSSSYRTSPHSSETSDSAGRKHKSISHTNFMPSSSAGPMSARRLDDGSYHNTATTELSSQYEKICSWQKDRDVDWNLVRSMTNRDKDAVSNEWPPNEVISPVVEWACQTNVKSAWSVLNTLVQSWTDEQVYYAAVLVPVDSTAAAAGQSLSAKTNGSTTTDDRTLLHVLQLSIGQLDLEDQDILDFSLVVNCLDRLESIDQTHQQNFQSVTAFILLSRIWRALDRLHQLVSNRKALQQNTRLDDEVWWVPMKDRGDEWVVRAVELSLKVLLGENRDFSEKSGTMQLDEDPQVDFLGNGLLSIPSMALACSSFLLNLADDTQQPSWVLESPKETTSALTKSLLSYCRQRSSETSPTFASNHAKAGLERQLVLAYYLLLLVLLPHDPADQPRREIVGTPSIPPAMSTCMMAALRRHLIREPRECTELGMQVDETGLFIRCLEAWCMTLDSQQRTALNDMVRLYCCGSRREGQFWEVLLRVIASKKMDFNSKGVLRVGVFLLKHVREPARAGLMEAIMSSRHSSAVSSSRNDPFAAFLDSLTSHKSPEAASMLRLLLRDSASHATHDELSRSLIESLDKDIVLSCFRSITDCSEDLAFHHVLLCLFDCLDVCLVSSTGIGMEVLLSLSSETVESILQIMTPKPIAGGPATRGKYHASLDSQGMTPPVNNFSRVDQTLMSVLEEDAPQRGLQRSVQIAASTVLCVLSQARISSIEDGHTTALQRRMGEAVLWFVSDGETSAFDELRPFDSGRWLRLLLSLGSLDEKHDYAVSHLQRRQFLLYDESQRLRRENTTLDSLVDFFRTKEKAHRREIDQINMCVDRVQHRASTQERLLRREADEMASVHHSERIKAEDSLREATNRMAEMSTRLQDSEREVDLRRAAENEIRTALKDAETRLREAESREQSAIKSADDYASKQVQTSRELATAHAKLDAASKSEEKLAAKIDVQTESLDRMEDSHRNMRDSLESLFGDLVGLAQLYEHKEKEESSLRGRHDAAVEILEKKLHAERARYIELKEKYQQTESENDMLSRKYSRVREKLENERQSRRREAAMKRRGAPVSYLNQLHTSTSGRNESDRSGVGKENDSSSSMATSRGSSRYR